MFFNLLVSENEISFWGVFLVDGKKKKIILLLGFWFIILFF